MVLGGSATSELLLNLVVKMWESDGPNEKARVLLVVSCAAAVVDVRLEPCDLCLNQLLKPGKLCIGILPILEPLPKIASLLQPVHFQEFV